LTLSSSRSVAIFHSGQRSENREIPRRPNDNLKTPCLIFSIVASCKFPNANNANLTVATIQKINETLLNNANDDYKHHHFDALNAFSLLKKHRNNVREMRKESIANFPSFAFALCVILDKKRHFLIKMIIQRLGSVHLIE